MASTYKCTMIFNQSGLGGFPPTGWSESFYGSFADSPTALAAITALAQIRAPMSNSSTTIIGVRVTNLANKGVSVRQFETALIGTMPDPDMPWNAVWIDLTTGSNLQRQYMMRGQCDDFIANEQWLPMGPTGTAWNGYFQTFAAALTKQWALNGRVRANPIVQVFSVDANGNVTTNSPIAVAQGTPVRFYRTRASNNLPVKSIFNVNLVTSGTQFSLFGWPTGITVPKGQIGVYQTGIDLITAVNIEGARKRSVGRPFGLLRGRVRRNRGSL